MANKLTLPQVLSYVSNLGWEVQQDSNIYHLYPDDEHTAILYSDEDSIVLETEISGYDPILSYSDLKKKTSPQFIKAEYTKVA